MALSLSFVQEQVANFAHNLMQHAVLRLFRTKSSKVKKADIILVACIDEQHANFDDFLNYYRQLGVNHFFFVALRKNKTVEQVAKDNEDVSLWRYSFRQIAIRRAYRARNALMQRHCRGHLCIVADPGEYLVYPQMETRNLRDLDDFMRNERRNSINAVCIDCYANQADPVDEPANSRQNYAWADRDGYYELPDEGYRSTVYGGPVMRTFGLEDPAHRVVLSRIPVVRWTWRHRFTDNQYGMRPFYTMKIRDWNNPPFSAVLLRYPFMASTYENEELQQRYIRLRYGAYYEKAIAEQTDFVDPKVSFKIGISHEIVRTGIMSQGNWF